MDWLEGVILGFWSGKAQLLDEKEKWKWNLVAQVWKSKDCFYWLTFLGKLLAFSSILQLHSFHSLQFMWKITKNFNSTSLHSSLLRWFHFMQWFSRLVELPNKPLIWSRVLKYGDFNTFNKGSELVYSDSPCCFWKFCCFAFLLLNYSMERFLAWESFNSLQRFTIKNWNYWGVLLRNGMERNWNWVWCSLNCYMLNVNKWVT